MATLAATPIELLVAWTRDHPAYTYAVDATELGGRGMVDSAFAVDYDGRVPIETVHVLAGNGAGTVIVWRSGDRVTVHPPGVLRPLALAMQVRDPRLLSPRRNDVRNAIFSRVADCVAAHAADVTVDRIGDRETFTIRDPSGVKCGPEDGDDAVTVDRVTVSALDEHPIMRERFAGTVLVEKWVVRDLHLEA